MKIILTCGHPDSGFQMAHTALTAAGLAQAQPSRRELLAATDIQAKIFEAYDQDSSGLSTTEQLAPGKIWQELAVDLFMGNMGQEAWGWADARTVWLLDFWKTFDPQVRFVLIYSSPEFAVGQALKNKAATREEIGRIVASWTAYNTQILSFYNRHPDQCLLANVAVSIHTPQLLVEEVANVFGTKFELDTSAYQSDRSCVSAIASSLAKALVRECDEAMALYRELESSANCDGGFAQEEDSQAWQEYSALLSEKERAISAASKQQVYIEQLGRELDEQARLSRERMAHIEQLTQVRDDQIRVASEQTLFLEETRKQMETQLAQLQGELLQSVGERDTLTERLTELQWQLTQVTQAHDEHARVSRERLSHIEQLTQEVHERQNKQDVAQESDLLLFQLHQVQEELERCLLHNHELVSREQNGSSLAAFATDFWRRQQPAEIIVDMRQEIVGDNWYYAEHDGRWAGPDEISTIRLPALRDGTYEMQMDIVDAKEPEILERMEVSVNGMPLEIDQAGEGVSALVNARFSSKKIAESPVWEFQFKFHKLVSPAQHGSDDQRNLAIRLQSLKLISI